MFEGRINEFKNCYLNSLNIRFLECFDDKQLKSILFFFYVEVIFFENFKTHFKSVEVSPYR